MIWTVIILIVGYILFRFYLDLKKDDYDLQGQTLSEKFKFIVDIINESAFQRNGKITVLDKTSFNLYQDSKNQIIHFTYSTGHLTITWKYKYFQKEVVYEKTFNNVRNISVFDQQKIANTVINEAALVILKHQQDVMSEIR